MLLVPGNACGLAGALEQIGLLGRVRGHGHGLLQERHRLVVAAERGRTSSGRLKCYSCLARKGVSLGVLAGIGVGGQVMRREGAGDLVAAE